MKAARWLIVALLLFVVISKSDNLRAQVLSIPSSKWGLSIGNSYDFTGLRLNFRDKNIGELRGLNVTLWKPAKHITGSFTGIGVGLISPGAENLHGLMVGGLGVQAENNLKGNIGWIVGRWGR